MTLRNLYNIVDSWTLTTAIEVYFEGTEMYPQTITFYDAYCKDYMGKEIVSFSPSAKPYYIILKER